MLHSDLKNRGKNILLLQQNHMMTKLSGCHTGFCAGGGKRWGWETLMYTYTKPDSFLKPTLL